MALSWNVKIEQMQSCFYAHKKNNTSSVTAETQEQNKNNAGLFKVKNPKVEKKESENSEINPREV